MQKPNSAQIALLITGGVGLIAAYFYLKSSSATPAATGTTAAFTGGYDTYPSKPSYMAADGSNDARCKKLMQALSQVHNALLHTDGMTPAQITAFRNQEAEILAMLQREGCKQNSTNHQK